jgi:hypothetical protein
MDFLPGSLGFDPLAHQVNPLLASNILWFDAFVGNVDRSWRNPNLLMWHRELWLIDHGATLTFHHSWSRSSGFTTKPYDVSSHVLSEMASERGKADALLAPLVTSSLLSEVLAEVPDVWLTDEEGFDSPASVRAAYVDHLLARLEAREEWRP